MGAPEQSRQTDPVGNGTALAFSRQHGPIFALALAQTH
jgi:hypothetical protein